MIAIKKFPKSGKYAVCVGVMEEYAKFNADGTFSNDAGIGMKVMSRKFDTLEEAKEAKEALESYKRKFG